MKVPCKVKSICPEVNIEEISTGNAYASTHNTHLYTSTHIQNNTTLICNSKINIHYYLSVVMESLSLISN